MAAGRTWQVRFSMAAMILPVGPPRTLARTEGNDSGATRPVGWGPAAQNRGGTTRTRRADGQRPRAIAAPTTTAPGLSDRDRKVLEFERQWWKYAGAKEQAVRELFDMSATRYYQVLNALLDDPEALAFDPMLVKRLRRMRASRQRQRSARRLGIDL